MTFLQRLAATLLVLPFLGFQGLAQEEAPAFPEPTSDTVSDFASVLDATEEGRISRILADIRASTGAQIVVVTAPGIDGLNGKGMRLEDFGTALFNAWGIGGEQDDGVLILIDTSAREARITLGAGYPPVYDDRAARVLATALLPELREGRIASGIEAGIISARDRLVLTRQSGETVGPLDGFETTGSGPGLPIAGIAAGAFGLVGFFIWRRARDRSLCPKCGAHGLKRTREVINPPTQFQQGLGLQHLTCSSCGFVDRLHYPINYSGRGGRRSRDDRGPGPGGSEGGSGGGKSEGGGASGKW